VDYRRYYTDPAEMVRVQLEAARRRRELPIHDFVLGEAPASWPVTVDFWPVPAPGWVGCELLYRAETVIAHRPRNLSPEECAARPMPDPRAGGLLAHLEERELALGRFDFFEFRGQDSAQEIRRTTERHSGDSIARRPHFFMAVLPRSL
jgi:hypothetical protein